MRPAGHHIREQIREDGGRSSDIKETQREVVVPEAPRGCEKQYFELEVRVEGGTMSCRWPESVASACALVRVGMGKILRRVRMLPR